jgi:hypothetical protein
MTSPRGRNREGEILVQRLISTARAKPIALAKLRNQRRPQMPDLAIGVVEGDLEKDPDWLDMVRSSAYRIKDASE